MASGAPDHIRLADDAHSRYTWTRRVEVSVNSVTNVTYTPIDIDFEGVLISFSSTNAWADTRYRIYVDDVEIQELRATTLWTSHRFRTPGQGFDITGVSIYDEINKLFGVWFYSHFMCYVKRNVRIEHFQNSGGNILVMFPTIYYLAR